MIDEKHRVRFEREINEVFICIYCFCAEIKVESWQP